MNFVEHYLNRHHLFHHPHKWFLAFILSPIHFAEVVYKKKYHLKFKQARKLFIFDTILLLSIVFTSVIAIFWQSYDPTVKNSVELSVKSSTDRKRSGDIISFEVNYKNFSKTTLKDMVLALNLPPHFFLTKSEPNKYFQPDLGSFHLPDLQPKEGGTISIAGRLFQTPGESVHISTFLSYRQESRTEREEKASAYISEPQSSILTAEIKMTDTILAEGLNQFILTVKNEGDVPLTVAVPFAKNKYGIFQNLNPAAGEIEGERWLVKGIQPGAEAECSGEYRAQILPDALIAEISFTPSIIVDNVSVQQKAAVKKLRVAHPKIDAEANWPAEQKFVSPGDAASVRVKLKNSGQDKLYNLAINIPLPAGIIDIKKIISENIGIVKNNTLALDYKKFTGLLSVPPGASIEITAKLPILITPAASTDLILSLTPRIHASVEGVISGTLEKSLPKIELPVGTKVSIAAELRYFTDDGDQLGRGPLPPMPGKETKYWAIINIKNTSSEIRGVQFHAHLSDRAIWTGKTSVSFGREISYNSQTKEIIWSSESIAAHESAGIYLELGYVPENNAEKNVILLDQISVTGRDSFTGAEVAANAAGLDTSLKADLIGRKR